MKRAASRLLVLALVAVAVLLIAAKPGGSKNGMEEVSRTTAQDLNHVEQQRLPDGTKVANNTGCAWDADDEIWTVHAGRLAGGESHTIIECVIEDWLDHLIVLIGTVKTKGSDLTISVEFVSRGEVISTSELVPRDNRYSELRICTYTTDYDRQDTSGEVVGEGYGWPTDIRYTVTNNSKRHAEVSLRAIISGDSSSAHERWGCVWDPHNR